MVQLASIRRSLFNNTERAKFLEQLVLGVKGILESPQVREVIISDILLPNLARYTLTEV